MTAISFDAARGIDSSEQRRVLQWLQEKRDCARRFANFAYPDIAVCGNDDGRDLDTLGMNS